VRFEADLVGKARGLLRREKSRKNGQRNFPQGKVEGFVSHGQEKRKGEMLTKSRNLRKIGGVAGIDLGWAAG